MGYRLDADGRLHDLTHKQIAKQRSEIGMVFQRFKPVPAHDCARQHHGSSHARAEDELLTRPALGPMNS
jgi:ABC-type polar amino acid transport system ATPase subunit